MGSSLTASPDDDELGKLQKDLEHVYTDFMIATISMVLSGVEPTQELRDRAEEVLRWTDKGALKQRIDEIRELRADALCWRAYQRELKDKKE